MLAATKTRGVSGVNWRPALAAETGMPSLDSGRRWPTCALDPVLHLRLAGR